MSILNQISHLFKRELVLEWRSKHAWSSLLLYVVATVFLCYVSFNFQQLNKVIGNTFFWIIILFTAVNAMAKGFMQEPKNRTLYYYSIASPAAIILSKMLYNCLLMMVLALVISVIYNVLFNHIVGDYLYYFLSVLIGSISFGTILTMTTAIVAKVGNNASLVAILSFPLIVPVIPLLVKFSKNALDGLDRSASFEEIVTLGAINVLVIVTALLLFPFLWQD